MRDTLTPQEQRDNVRSIIEKAREYNRVDCAKYVATGNIAKSIEVANRFEQMSSRLMEMADDECKKQPIQLGWTPT